jgi:hypothetical protein
LMQLLFHLKELRVQPQPLGAIHHGGKVRRSGWVYVAYLGPSARPPDSGKAQDQRQLLHKS